MRTIILPLPSRHIGNRRTPFILYSRCTLELFSVGGGEILVYSQSRALTAPIHVIAHEGLGQEASNYRSV